MPERDLDSLIKEALTEAAKRQQWDGKMTVVHENGIAYLFCDDREVAFMASDVFEALCKSEDFR